jgi:DNA repair protein RadC
MTRFSTLPKDEQPAERLLLHGAQTLSDAELVAVVTGAQSMETPRDLIRDGLPAFARYDWGAGTRHRIPRRHAAKIAAALELGRRVAADVRPDSPCITHADQLGPGLIARHAHKPQEELGGVFLDSRHRVIREVAAIYRGTINSSVATSRDVIRVALDVHAVAVIVFHQHPSGFPEPSSEDYAFTRDLAAACKMMHVELLDHLILGSSRYVSMKERGCLR